NPESQGDAADQIVPGGGKDRRSVRQPLQRIRDDAWRMSRISTATAPVSARFVPFVAEAAFAALLFLSFVGFMPFAARTPQLLALGENGFSGAGDAARQVAYLLVFAVTIVAAIERRGLRTFANLPVAFAILLIWCVASAAWSLQPAVTFRRAGLEIIVVLS